MSNSDNTISESKNEDQSVAIRKKSDLSSDKAKTSSMVIVALLISILAIIGSGYVWQQFASSTIKQQEIQSELDAVLKVSSEQLVLVEDLRRTLQVANDEQLRQRQSIQNQLGIIQQELTAQKNKLQSLSTTDRADWLLAEADYLMRLANQRLLIGKDVASSLNFLRAADDIVRELDDSALYPVRESLAENIASLRTVGIFDIEGLYFELAGLAGQIERLQLVELKKFQLPDAEVPIAETWQQRLESGFLAAVDRLNNYIQITRRDEPYKPMLSPEYEMVVRQNIRLMLEQAQSAVLTGKQQVYVDSLGKAKYWVESYYTLNTQSTDAVINMINELVKKRITVKLPDISSSSRTLKYYLETIHNVENRKTKIVDEPADNAVTVEVVEP